MLTGDGELQEGQLWESLASAAHRGLGEIVVVVDHNKIQSDTWVSRVSDLGDVEAKFRAFGWHVSRCDGHDVAAIERVMRSLDAVKDQPKVIVADTVKGRGVDFMEGPALKDGELYGYHSGAPSEPNYLAGLEQLLVQANAAMADLGLGAARTEATVRNPRREPRQTDNLVAAYERALVAQGEKRPNLLALDADLIKDCGLVSFATRFPDRFIECGIAEQDMVSMAGGMARRGALPVVHSFACFLAARPNEQIYNQCSEHSKVVYVASLAGLLPGGPGHSHQSVRDISALAAVPGLVMAEPTVEAEVAPLYDHLLERPESAYLRLVSVKWPMPFAYPAGHTPRGGAGVDRSRRHRRADHRLRSLDACERVSGRRGPAAADRRRRAHRRAAVAEPHRSGVAQADHRHAPRRRHAGQPLRPRRPGRHGGGGDRRAGHRPRRARHSHRRRGAARVRHQRRGAGAPSAGRGRPGGAARNGAGVAADRRRAQPTMTVLFWDIDGTLLTTAKGGMFAWDDAVKEITGRDFQLASMRIPGMTDYQIAVRTLETLGLPADGDLLERLVRRYEELLPTSLPRKVGHVLPNVRPILEGLAARDDVRSYLLTGNTRGGAHAKLTHYGLWSFFPDGAFAEDANERSTIARRAMQLVRRFRPAQ